MMKYATSKGIQIKYVFCITSPSIYFEIIGFNRILHSLNFFQLFFHNSFLFELTPNVNPFDAKLSVITIYILFHFTKLRIELSVYLETGRGRERRVQQLDVPF